MGLSQFFYNLRQPRLVLLWDRREDFQDARGQIFDIIGGELKHDFEGVIE